MFYYPQLDDGDKHNGVFLVPANPALIASLLRMRNTLVGASAPDSIIDFRMPRPIADARQCGFCKAAPTCTALHHTLEGGDQFTFGVPELFHSSAAHLTHAHASYVAFWLKCIAVEERSSRHSAREMTALSAPERESLGRAVAQLTLVSVEKAPAEGMSGVASGQTWIHGFERLPCDSAPSAATAIDAVTSAVAAANPTLAAASSLASGSANPPPTPLDEAGFAQGDVVAISVVRPSLPALPIAHASPSTATIATRWQICRGVVVGASGSQLRLSLECRLPDLGVPIHTRPAGGAAAKRSSDGKAHAGPAAPLPAVLRLDRCEIMSGFATLRANIIALVAPQPRAQDAQQPQQQQPQPQHQHPEQHQQHQQPPPSPTRLSELIVDLAPPRFASLNDLSALHQRLPPSESARLASLNQGQAESVARVLRCHDYALVLGMPGTGKTTLIAAAARALVALGQTVLLSAYTHSAVDSLLLKLLDEGVPFVRLGAPSKVHPRVRPHTLQVLIDQAHESGGDGGDGGGGGGGSPPPPAVVQARVEAQLASRPIIATTALSLKDAMLYGRIFDVAIVDEAGQITEPACLGPLRIARRFVLVGDHYQLPPLVVQTEAQGLGMGTSLFARLAEAHPRAVSTLSAQYRMAAPIMAVSNTLMYGGALTCGSEAVASLCLRLPDAGGMPAPAAKPEAWEAARRWEAEQLQLQQQHHHHQQPSPLPPPSPRHARWLEAAMAAERRVVFLDTHFTPAPEDRYEGRHHVYNAVEASLCVQILHAYVACGVPPSSLAFISPYRAQLRRARAELAARNLASDGTGVQVLTIDQSQGRDYTCVVVSLVRSNSTSDTGALLADHRRLNVAFSRAKCKMVVVGGRATLASSPILEAFLSLVTCSGWCIALPPRAHELYKPEAGAGGLLVEAGAGVAMVEAGAGAPEVC